jgi:forespore regulator of the sigma-K checkpoint
VYLLVAAVLAYLLVKPNGSGYRETGETQVRSAFQPAVQSEAEHQEEVLETIVTEKKPRETYIQKVYVCGEEMKKLGKMQPEEIVNTHQKHPEWQIGLSPEGHVVFTENIDDLSPKCKENGYFGIDANGNLSLYDGVPGKDNVIRTFFQLNIRHLESSLPRDTVKQLYSGIRVSDMAEYNSVLSTFSDYAVEATQKAMKPQTQ